MPFRRSGPGTPGQAVRRAASAYARRPARLVRGLRLAGGGRREGIGGLGISFDGAVVGGINEDDHSSNAKVERLIDLVSNPPPPPRPTRPRAQRGDGARRLGLGLGLGGGAEPGGDGRDAAQTRDPGPGPQARLAPLAGPPPRPASLATPDVWAAEGGHVATHVVRARLPPSE